TGFELMENSKFGITQFQERLCHTATRKAAAPSSSRLDRVHDVRLKLATQGRAQGFGDGLRADGKQQVRHHPVPGTPVPYRYTEGGGAIL
ncbi:hypothetical protein, partial [Escherichia coli]|uniref:hypothetical protein n=1 Tax=Escherichia coli TaxID=562 RepID=UPI00207B0FB2